MGVTPGPHLLPHVMLKQVSSGRFFRILFYENRRLRLPKCCKGYFGRDCQGEGASYHLAILKGLCDHCAVFESTDAVGGGGGGAAANSSSLPASVQMQRGDSELMLSFDYCNIRTGRKAPTKARADVNTQGLVSLEKFQL